MNKNTVLVGRGGFEPPKSKTSDLQSDPFGHSGICPYIIVRGALWSRWLDSNPQPADYKSAALPIELHRQVVLLAFGCKKQLFTPFLSLQPINHVSVTNALFTCALLVTVPFLPRFSIYRALVSRISNLQYPLTTLNASPFGCCVECGALGRNRTTDRQIFSLLLYRLSYQGKCGDPKRARTVDLQRDRLAL